MIRINVPYQIHYCVMRKDEIIKKINQFEKYENYQLKANGFCKSISFKMQETISLQLIIDLISDSYIRIYKGQMIIIIEAILNRLIELHDQELSHGQLYPQNILISFDNKTGFISTFQKIEIKQIHFIRYEYFEEPNYQINQKQDIQQILKTIIQFVSCMQDQFKDCQILTYINLFFQNQQENKQSINLREILKELKLQTNTYLLLDKIQQQFKSKEVETKLIDFFSIFQQRNVFQAPIQSVIEILTKHNLNEKIFIDCDDKLNCFPEQIGKFMDFNQIEKNIFAEVFELKFKANIVTELFIYFGKYFGQDKSNGFITLVEQFQNQINNNLQQFFNYLFPKIMQEYLHIQKSIEEIKKQIKNPFNKSIEIEIPYDLAETLFQSELKLLLDDFKLFNQDSDKFLKQIKEKFKKRLTNYYILRMEQEKIKISNEIL